VLVLPIAGVVLLIAGIIYKPRKKPKNVTGDSPSRYSFFTEISNNGSLFAFNSQFIGQIFNALNINRFFW
jgi:hypothetical protein